MREETDADAEAEDLEETTEAEEALAEATELREEALLLPTDAAEDALFEKEDALAEATDDRETALAEATEARDEADERKALPAETAEDEATDAAPEEKKEEEEKLEIGSRSEVGIEERDSLKALFEAATADLLASLEAEGAAVAAHFEYDDATELAEELGGRKDEERSASGLCSVDQNE